MLMLSKQTRQILIALAAIAVLFSALFFTGMVQLRAVLLEIQETNR